MQQGFRMEEKHVVVWIYLSAKHLFVLKLFYTETENLQVKYKELSHPPDPDFSTLNISLHWPISLTLHVSLSQSCDVERGVESPFFLLKASTSGKT